MSVSACHNSIINIDEEILHAGLDAIPGGR